MPKKILLQNHTSIRGINQPRSKLPYPHPPTNCSGGCPEGLRKVPIRVFYFSFFSESDRNSLFPIRPPANLKDAAGLTRNTLTLTAKVETIAQEDSPSEPPRSGHKSATIKDPLPQHPPPLPSAQGVVMEGLRKVPIRVRQTSSWRLS
ncbi:hypothetical protein CEXT_128151 [Caerostris extrusa]|uniref:Uncharacterized protein n=1 Tax=Caerostris extrusa TaxID=172846 RepID=A0AAV4P038_CAEEX|nr:hypothetical protein CEXT_128151 [Caerostris extrusa]